MPRSADAVHEADVVFELLFGVDRTGSSGSEHVGGRLAARFGVDAEVGDWVLNQRCRISLEKRENQAPGSAIAPDGTCLPEGTATVTIGREHVAAGSREGLSWLAAR